MPGVRKRSVIVIGAGLSGLYSAYLLKKKGYKVTVLEGRSRLGGRVDSHIVDEKEKLVVEMGAEWVGKTHQRMLKLCARFRLSLVNHNLKTHLLYKDKYYKPHQWSFSKAWQDRVEKLVKSFPHLNSKQLENLNGKDWWHFLLRNHISKRDLEILNLIESTDYGESIRFTSALEVITDMFTGGNTDLECYYRIDKGNVRLAHKLAEAIGIKNVHLRHKAKKIRQTAEGVEVYTPSNVFKAKKVIVSLPASSIIDLAWSPRLPVDKTDAYWSLTYSRILKVAILFKKRFWRAESFQMITDQLPHCIYHATQNQKGHKGVLTSYSVGSRAEIMARLNEKEKVSEILRTLSIPFGDVSNQVDKVLAYYWAEDPYTKGAYALYEKNLPLDYKQMFTTPFQNTFFCGEHTAMNQGFMEGALESAERVVGEILQSE